jgi:hypothetical protein
MFAGKIIESRTAIKNSLFCIHSTPCCIVAMRNLKISLLFHFINQAIVMPKMKQREKYVKSGFSPMKVMLLL